MQSGSGNYSPEQVRRLIYQLGGAFRLYHSFIGEQKKNRFFFIMNFSPSSDSILIVPTATTQIDRRRKFRRPEALVDITPGHYQPLRVDSVIDCESGAMVWNRSFLEDKIQKGLIDPLPPLPADIVEKLHQAIAVSRTLTPNQKSLVLPSE